MMTEGDRERERDMYREIEGAWEIERERGERDMQMESEMDMEMQIERGVR